MGWFKRNDPWQGDCRSCGHDWREHEIDDEGSTACSECLYEINQDVPDAPAVPCHLTPRNGTANRVDASAQDAAAEPQESGIVVLEPSLARPLPWGAGRIGIITGNEEFRGRLVLISPYVSDRSEFVVYIAHQELTESFWSVQYLAEALDDLKIVWIESGTAEELLERKVFGIRDSFHNRK